jgi:hypothetical protein
MVTEDREEQRKKANQHQAFQEVEEFLRIIESLGHNILLRQSKQDERINHICLCVLTQTVVRS